MVEKRGLILPELIVTGRCVVGALDGGETVPVRHRNGRDYLAKDKRATSRPFARSRRRKVELWRRPPGILGFETGRAMPDDTA